MKREARPKVTAPHPHRSTESSSQSIAALPAPRYALGWATLVYAVSTLCLGYPALVGKFLVNPASDQYIAGYAFREFAASTLRQTGGFPLWNPYLFGGMPYVAAMHGDIFYPTFLLRMVLPTDVAMTWGFIIHLFLAGLFTYLFLRAWGFGFFPALVAGIAYLLSGQIASYASPGHDGKLFVSALFPLVLLLVLRGIRDGRLWAWGALALTIGLVVLSPHPQLLQYLLLSSGAFALFCAFGRAGEGSSGLDRKVAVRRLACAAGAVILGLAMGAIQYLPVREYVDWSPRAGGVSYDRATSYSMPIEELINVYLPQFSGMLDGYWGRNPIKLHSEYLGVVILVLAFAAFGSGAVRQARKRFLWFWSATTIVTLFWALGGNTPFYRLVYALVPGTKFFRAPSTIFFIVCFGIAVLSAIGLERILSREVGRRYVLGWLIGGGAVALLATAGGFTGLATSIATPQQFDAAQANSSAVILGAWRSFFFVAVACGILLAHMRQKLTAKAAAWALIAAVALDLWSVERRYWMFSPPAHQLYASDPIIEYIKKQDQPGRVLPFALAPTEAPRDPFFHFDALMSHDIRIVEGYHGNHLGRYDLVRENLGNPNVWKLENVRYLLTNVAESPIPAAEKLVGPVKNAAGSTSYLFRVPGDNPAAWVTPVIVKAPDDAVQATVFNPAFDLRRAALFDTSANVRGQQITTLPDTLPIHASVITYRPGRIAVQLDAPAPAGSALIVSENYYPGWQATADGKPAKTGRADLVLVGVELPAGAQKIELTFRSTAYEKGKTVTLVALAACLALALAGFWVGRRRGQAQLDKGHAAGA